MWPPFWWSGNRLARALDCIKFKQYMGHRHISPRKNSWFFMAWLLFVLSSTHGFDQSLIWESFLANVTKKIMIYCNDPFCPWNRKKNGVQKFWRMYSLILRKENEKGKERSLIPFSYELLSFYSLCFPSSLFFHGSAFSNILLSSFLPQISPLSIFNFKS